MVRKVGTYTAAFLDVIRFVSRAGEIIPRGNIECHPEFQALCGKAYPAHSGVVNELPDPAIIIALAALIVCLPGSFHLFW